MKNSIPKNHAEFEKLFAEYRETKNRLDMADLKLADKQAALAAKHQQETTSDRDRLKHIAAQLQQYATDHRAELTDNGKTQTIKTVSGCLMWRKVRSTVEIDRNLTDDVLAEIRKRNWTQFIRVKEEPNKTAMLAERDLLERNPIIGVSIVDGKETFTIETA